MVRSGSVALPLFLLAFVTGAQPYPEIQWWFDLDSPSLGSAAAADIDGDGRPEIVFGTYFNDETFYALNGEDGSLLWSFPTGGCNDASPVIADVDQDGQLEVIAPVSSGCMVYCLDGVTGAVKWSASTGIPNCIDSPPSVGDVTGDGKLEVLMGTFNGYVFCFAGEDGHEVWRCSLDVSSAIQTSPNLLDVTGDGELDVLVAQWGGEHRIAALNGSDGSIIWSTDIPSGHMYHGASIGDVTGDGKTELVIGSYDQNIYMFNAEDGSFRWHSPMPSYVAAPTSLADVDGDGNLEILYAAAGRIGLLDRYGTPVWTYYSDVGFRGGVFCDIDGDTITDIVFGTNDGHLIALRGTSPDVIWEIDLAAHYGNTFIIDHAPVVGDFDGDGRTDVFVVGGYATSSSPQDNHGRAYMLTAGEGTGPGCSVFRYGIRRNGFYDRGQTGIGFEGPAPPFGAVLHPNPLRNAGELNFILEASAEVSLDVYDLSGRIALRRTEGVLEAGECTAVLDLAVLPPGVYLVVLRVEGSPGLPLRAVKL